MDPVRRCHRRDGALQVVRGSHKLGRLLPHHLENRVGHPDSWYLYIKDEDVPDAEIVTCEMRKGLGPLALEHDDPPLDRELFRQGALEHRPPLPATGDPTGYPSESKLPPMRKSDNPTYRLDWEAWFVAQQDEQDFQKIKKLPEDEFEFSAPDAPLARALAEVLGGGRVSRPGFQFFPGLDVLATGREEAWRKAKY